MLTVVAFLIALGLLIAVHEYGHYRVAVACGVKVLRFSIGFGRPLLRWGGRNGATEFVIGALPLGGYVRMLDEREAPVDAHERHLAFNNRPLRQRAAIVAAGPAANLVLAVLLYAVVAWTGVQSPQPVIAAPASGSLAESAGLRGGDWIVQLAGPGEEPEPLQSFDELRWQLTSAALEGRDLRLWVADGPQAPGRELALPLSTLQARDADAQLGQRIGILGPWTEPVMGAVMEGGAAQRAGLRPGDRVQSVDGQPVSDGQALRARIRDAVDAQGRERAQRWVVRRDGAAVELAVTPSAEWQGGRWVGRIGAYVGGAPAMAEVRFGPVEGLLHGLTKTWEVSALTVAMMGRMLVGEASIRNLSGPLTIADYAGKSATLGLAPYLLFLALVSVSLGVLNLLPLPVLDGGHLMYYLWEAVTGKPVPEAWLDRLQRGGVAVLLALTSIALFNDVARLVG